MSDTDNNIVLDIKDLYVEFRTRDSVVKAVNGIDLRIPRGHALGLVGETGAGIGAVMRCLHRSGEPRLELPVGNICILWRTNRLLNQTNQVKP